MLTAIGTYENATTLKYTAPDSIILTSLVYKPIICLGKNPDVNKNTEEIKIPTTRLTQKLLHASFSSFAPINCAIKIPATVLTAPITTEKINE